MFGLMAPLIISGSWVEKMKFEAFLVFIIIWPILVYYPIAHWIWNGSGFLNKYFKTADFAGGLVIHTNTGVSAFIVSYLLKKRLQHGEALAAAYHNLPISLNRGSR